MRRLNGPELAALALAMLIMVLGLVMISRSSGELIFHGSTHSAPASAEGRSRSYGTVAIVLGAGIMVMVLYRRRK
jgi:hypothetical protein